MFKKSLKSQLSFTIAMVVFVTVASISILSNISINQKFKEYIAQQQQQKTEEIVSSLNQQYNLEKDEWNIDFIHTIGMYALYDGYIIRVYDGNGISVWDANRHDMTLCTQVMADISERMQTKYPHLNGEFTSQDYLLSQDNRMIGMVAISYYGPYFLSENDFQFLRALNTILISIGTFSLILALTIGWKLAARISRPITKTIDMAKEISEGNYEIRFEGTTKLQELDALTHSINNLAGTLNEQEGLRKKLTADVAHELRTPLATVGTHLEAMIEGVWKPTNDRLKSCHEEILRIANLVKDLERLAKVESDNLKLKLSLIDLEEIVRMVCGNFETELYMKSLNLSIEGNSSCIIGDKDRITQVILNLISNAIKYTPQNGSINICLKDEDESISIFIEDNGIGISKEEIPFIFERFYRADKSRNRKTGGAGIGLAIVKSIVAAHGGSVEVSSQLGSGSCFKVAFPKQKFKDKII